MKNMLTKGMYSQFYKKHLGKHTPSRLFLATKAYTVISCQKIELNFVPKTVTWMKIANTYSSKSQFYCQNSRFPPSIFLLKLFFIWLCHNGRDTTTASANYFGPVPPNPLCQLSLWEETEVPGENPLLS